MTAEDLLSPGQHPGSKDPAKPGPAHAAGSTSYSYDANSNETAAGSTTYTYNLANQLASVTSGSTTTGYSYNGDGNRTSATTGSQTTNYLWDTNAAGGLPQLALERDGSGNLIRRYIYGTRRISMASGGANYYYQYDLLGSVTNVTSATGATEWTNSYEPFGAIRTQTQNDPNAPANPMQFAGEYLDPTGLYDLRARTYDPSTGRLLTQDPLTGLAGSSAISSYAYASDRPGVLIDPSGMTFVPSDSGTRSLELASSPSDAVGYDAPAAWPVRRIASAFSFFVSRGLARFQSAGLVGNFLMETGETLDPAIHQRGGGPGRGIAQWGVGVNGRWQGALALARKDGVSPLTLNLQLRYAWQELHTTYAAAYVALRHTNGVTDATTVVMNDYEQPDPSTENLPRRIRDAKYVLGHF